MYQSYYMTYLAIAMSSHTIRARSKKILVVGDSRLRHMDLDLNAMDSDFAFICKCLPGGNLWRVMQVAKETILHNNTFFLIIIFAGINDITQLVKKQ